MGLTTSYTLAAVVAARGRLSFENSPHFRADLFDALGDNPPLSLQAQTIDPWAARRSPIDRLQLDRELFERDFEPGVLVELRSAVRGPWAGGGEVAHNCEHR